MTDKVEDLVRLSLKRPVKIFINENVDVTPLLKQEFVRLRDASEANREAILAGEDLCVFKCENFSWWFIELRVFFSFLILKCFLFTIKLN